MTVTTRIPLGQAFGNAATAIEAVGWSKRTWHNVDGQPCMLQAVYDQLGLNEADKGPVAKAVASRLVSAILAKYSNCRLVKPEKGPIVQAYCWNDRKRTTRKQVVTVLRLAASMSEIDEITQINSTEVTAANQERVLVGA